LELRQDVGCERAFRRHRSAEEGAENPKADNHGPGEERFRPQKEANPFPPGDSRLVRLRRRHIRHGRALGEDDSFFRRAH
jgi:hypothetical protein